MLFQKASILPDEEGVLAVLDQIDMDIKYVDGEQKGNNLRRRCNSLHTRT